MRRTSLLIAVFTVAAGVSVCSSNGVTARENGDIASRIDMASKPSLASWPRKINPLHVLVVFTKFMGEAPGDTLAPSWAKDLFNGQPGSVNDYFHAVSFGQYKITGEYLPKMYEMPYDTTYYKTSSLYTLDAIQMLDDDPSFSFADYDNDGLDGIPNSGDDDGYADYIVLLPRTRPYNFILKLATGTMNLSLNYEFITSDRKAGGGLIKADKYSGCIVVAPTRSQAAGIIIAEIAHAFGAEDLMDKVYDTPKIDSAGVGYWCVLGWGATGWAGNSIPIGPCAYNRMLMNCIGINNANLTDIYGVHQGLRMKDVGEPDGKVYRVWISREEYFLLEYRNNEGSLYYDSPLPKSGILIWHVKEGESNSTEETKLCDLECPDGRYLDAGFPMGKYPDPINGGDNLDFWAHDRQYMLEHNGNFGDATDVYDGVVYTSFGTRTNPGSNANRMGASTGIEIYNIRKVGNEMLFDCYIPPIPDKLPIKAPAVGLAFQRSNGTGLEQYLDFRKSVYMVNFGLGYKPDMLVTVLRDTMFVTDVTSLNQYELQKMVALSLSGNQSLANAEINRENVPVGEFEQTIRQFDVCLDDLGLERPPLWIQKAVLRDDVRALPSLIRIGQNYPNPFNSETTVPFTLSSGGPVILKVYDILGRKVLEVDQGFRNSGLHSLKIPAERLASGVYFYRIMGMSVSETKRFVIMK